MKKNNKINHMFVCDVCGKPATYNLQNCWNSYTIDKDGNFEDYDAYEGDGNEFYCDKHWETK
jgi:hypothetical protein